LARNRKRAKERRDRRANGSPRRPDVSPADAEPTPSPIEHAAPDAELADAQLAMGRPADVVGPVPSGLEFEDGDEAGNGQPEPPAGAIAPPIDPGAPIGTRLVGFLQGSWRELQRVQWPDRRQVAQATGVVIGFVIVAGVFLGLADLAATHLMQFILK
jgi:preprotein translocase subunit SecE